MEFCRKHTLTSSVTQHQHYLLQGIMNFFMDHGKVALVAFENVATQEEFERTLAHQAPTQLGCEIIPLHAGENEDVLQTFNALLARISLQQATQATDVAHANYLLWVSENEHFTPELFQLLKKIILQFSGLQLKLYISVTSDRWNEHLFDIAGRKIAYWFIPASSPAPELSAPPSAATLPATPGIRSRSLHLWVSSIAVLVLLAAAAYGLRDKAEFFGSAPSASANTQDKDTRSEAQAEAKASDAQRLSPLAEVVSSSAFNSAAPAATTAATLEAWPASVRSAALIASSATAPSNAAPSAAPSAAGVSVPVSAAPPATQALGINTQADCPAGTENLPTARPTSYIKDTNYIYIKSPQSRKICVAAAGSAYKLVNLSANKGTTVYGNSPWRVYSPELRRVELYFQGARVVLAPSVTDHVQVVPR